MIPILYETGETAFTTEGIGRLVDCIECSVTEERNGIYECEFTYPVDGRHYSDIQEGRIICVIHDDSRTIQPFDIYGRSAPLDGLVTFYAHHISYRLGNIVLMPFTATVSTIAMSRLQIYSVTGNPFTFWTDINSGGRFTVEYPKSIREILGGSDGSLIDVYGGEYEFDKFDVKLYANRGIDTDVEIRYGKNLTDLKHDVDVSGSYNAVLPYYKSGDDPPVIPGSIVISSHVETESVNLTTDTGEDITTNTGEAIELYTAEYTVAPLDLSSNFDTKPTEAQLVSEAQDYMNKNRPWDPSENITVDFIALWQMPEYEQYTNLQRVRLCDTVSVIYPELGVNAVRQKVIKVVYDVLNERYTSIELGQTEKSLAQTIQYSTQKILENVPTKSMLADAIAEATSKITGGRGGHVVFNTDGEGNPDEILIMDTDSISTAVSVIRINKNGIGFSQTGYQGPFRSAWTIDGKFNADFITVGNLDANLIHTGTMLANRIYGGTLIMGGEGNGNGVIRVNNSSGTQIGYWNNTGLNITKGSISGTRIVAYADSTNTNYVVLDVDGLECYSRGEKILTYGADLGNSNVAYETIYKQKQTRVKNGGEISFFGDTGTSYTSFRFDDGLSVHGGGTVTALTSNSSNDYAANILSIYDKPGSSATKMDAILFGTSKTSPRIYTQPINRRRLEIAGFDTLYVYGGIGCSGTKSRVVTTKDYGIRELYCYETPSPVFGDIGEGTIAENGMCYVYLDPIFSQTVSLNQYQVFLQKYGDGKCYVSERNSAYFIVNGSPGLSFGWEIKAKQGDYDQLRLRKTVGNASIENSIDYGYLAAEHQKEIAEGRIP